MFFETETLIRWLGLGVFVLITFLIHRKLSGRQGRFSFFGHKSSAMFDLWSIQHFLSGIIVSWLIFRLVAWTSFSNQFGWLFIICCVAYIWEFFEVFMEAGYFGQKIAVWKDGFEHWSNRFISDPLTAVLGAMVFISFSWIIWPALVFNFTWFILNIRRPHSMEIQNKIVKFFKR